MIQAGVAIENPVTGERLVFHATSAETNGELVQFDALVRPGGFVAAAHLHPKQEEEFRVVRGRLGFRVGRVRFQAGRGRTIIVPAGTPHKFWNVGDDWAHLAVEIRPALQFERLIETMFGLAADGKTNRKGMPNPLRLAVIARHHFDDVRLPFPPAWMQRMGLALGAPVGRVLGYQATYVPAGVDSAQPVTESV
jgi:mannose-6-phosphate isomerase-like protein (cupin superfamily)